MNFTTPRPTPDAWVSYMGSRGRRKSPVFFDNAFGLRLNVSDEATPMLKYLAQSFPGEFSRALRAVGFELRRAMVKNVVTGGPRSTPWRQLSGLKSVRDSDIRGGKRLQRGRAARNFFGDLGAPGGRIGKSPIAYSYDKKAAKVTVGWMSFEARRWAAKLQDGFKIPVTTKMRHHFLASKVGLTGKSSIEIPARPLVAPTWEDEKSVLMRRMELRIYAYVKGLKAKDATRYVRDNS